MTKKVGMLAARRDHVMRQIFADGLAKAIADKVGVRYQAVQQWKRVPAAHVLTLAPLLQMEPEDIRPDVFRPIKGCVMIWNDAADELLIRTLGRRGKPRLRCPRNEERRIASSAEIQLQADDIALPIEAFVRRGSAPPLKTKPPPVRKRSPRPRKPNVKVSSRKPVTTRRSSRSRSTSASSISNRRGSDAKR